MHIYIYIYIYIYMCVCVCVCANIFSTFIIYTDRYTYKAKPWMSVCLYVHTLHDRQTCKHMYVKYGCGVPDYKDKFSKKTTTTTKKNKTKKKQNKKKKQHRPLKKSKKFYLDWTLDTILMYSLHKSQTTEPWFPTTVLLTDLFIQTKRLMSKIICFY